MQIVDGQQDDNILIEAELQKVDEQTQAGSKCRACGIMLVFAVFFGICVGSEVSYGGYIATYCVNYLHTEKSVGRYMTSVYWLGLSVGRLCAVFISHRLKTFHMLMVDFLGLLVGNVMLMAFSKTVSVSYVASFVYGFGMASMFPCAFLYGEETVAVTGKFATAMIVGASVGEFIFPSLLGNLMHWIDDQVFEIYMLMLTASMCLILIFIRCIRRNVPT